MNKIKYIILIITILIFNGCLYKPLPINENNKNTKIGVISIIDDKIDLEFKGTTIFQNKYTTTDIKKWNLSNFLINITENKLNEKSNLSVLNIDYDINLLKTRAYTKNITGHFGGYDLTDKLKENLNELFIKNKFDYLILILPSKMNGIKVYKENFLGAKYSMLYLKYSLKLIDKKSLDVKTLSYLADDTYIGYSYWDENKKLLSTDNSKRLENIVKQTIQNNIVKSLSSMGLITE